MHSIKEILGQLIAYPSVTPMDKGTQEYMQEMLNALGFQTQIMNQGPVSNFFSCYGTQGPLLVFAGHTDVVPIGDINKWHIPPFELHEKDGLLYGRGVADMKGSLACMLKMAERFINDHPTFPGRLGFLITSGEEGDDFNFGTPYVMEQLQKQGISIDYCIVGEPSSTKHTGDVIKIGRRGSLSARITLHGKQGHVAYPHLADNAIHKTSPFLSELVAVAWDKGNAFFPPTSMQITSIHAGADAGNIIPGSLELALNFRYSTEQTEHSLKEKLGNLFHKHQLQPEIRWQLNGLPFLTDQGMLINSCQDAIKEHTGHISELSTSGGTSDGRFIAPYGVEVVELGPVNATIHQVNECVSLQDLELLESIYYSIASRIFFKK